ncbi:hypothetical protein DXG01_007821 [Tephrocybe rancida]|nr:hypothetical protein DXG01_007821 [Tephrocybe rancida]
MPPSSETEPQRATSNDQSAGVKHQERHRIQEATRGTYQSTETISTSTTAPPNHQEGDTQQASWSSTFQPQASAAPQQENSPPYTTTYAAAIHTTNPAVTPLPHKRSSHRTIPLPPVDEPDVFVMENAMALTGTEGPSDSQNLGLPTLHPILAHAMLSTTMPDEFPAHTNLTSSRREWAQHWSEPATDHDIETLTILCATTGQVIPVRPWFATPGRIVTVGDVVSILEAVGITLVVDEDRMSVQREDQTILRRKRIRLVTNSLMLWWENWEEGQHPWYLVVDE